MIEKNKKGVVVLVNKWDLIENKDQHYTKEYEDKLREDLAPFKDVPILFTSTITKQRLHKALEKTRELQQIIARAAARTLSRATPPGLIFSNKPTAVAAPLYCDMPPRINKNSGEVLRLERLRLKAI